MKQKASVRMQRRYLLLANVKKEMVEKTLFDYLGIFGVAKAAPIFMHKERKLVLAVSREALNEVRAALELAAIKVYRVSGTLKGLGA